MLCVEEIPWATGVLMIATVTIAALWVIAIVLILLFMSGAK